MKPEYDFSKGVRGPICSTELVAPGKVRVSVELDEEIVDYFFKQADESGGRIGHSTLINQILKDYINTGV